MKTSDCKLQCSNYESPAGPGRVVLMWASLNHQLSQNVLDRSSPNFQESYKYGWEVLYAISQVRCNGNRFLAQIGENWETHLYPVGWHSRTWMCALTPPITPLRLKKLVNFRPVTGEFFRRVKSRRAGYTLGFAMHF